KDIQKRLQQMLGTIVGAESVIVSVTADVDFTQKNTTKELVEPVDVVNMKGIPVSIETLQETFEGTGAEGGVAGTVMKISRIILLQIAEEKGIMNQQKKR